MAKDPAFLFYSSDFTVGTQLFTHEQKGRYMDLLCLQHQKGHLSEEDMLKICKTHDKDVFAKFIKDDAGLFYNERLELEVQKRKNYSESRRNNRSGDPLKPKPVKRKRSPKSYVPHMENENEIIYPFKNEGFIKIWSDWKNYKKSQFNFEYKTNTSEQTALKILCRESGSDESNATLMLESAISRGYKGWIPISDTNFYKPIKQQSKGLNF